MQLAAALGAVGLSVSPTSWVLGGICVIGIVGLTNAFNMLDNMDLLSAGTAWVAAAALAVVSVGSSDPHMSACGIWPWLLLGALSGFSWFNRPPARIFMGDVGSTFLGFFLSAFAIYAARPTATPAGWLFLAFLFAVPCYDMTAVVLIRLRQGRSPFHADKQHLSHRLVAIGLSPPRAVAVIHGLAVLSALAAIALTRTSTPAGRWLVVTAFVVGWGAFIAFDIGMAVRRSRETVP
jgi:UDP-GlcNAc:undecaprenyl-phosphate GlcNAc-1-phosphate transferase